MFCLQLTDGRQRLRRVTVHRAQADLSVFSKTAVSQLHGMHENPLLGILVWFCGNPLDTVTACMCQSCCCRTHHIEPHASIELKAFLPCCVLLVATRCYAELQHYICLSVMSTHVPACKGRNFGDHGTHLRTFKLFRRLYMYRPGQGTFQPVPAMPPHLPSQICRALESLHLINTAGRLLYSDT